MDDLYQEHILDHYKHPRNFGKIEEVVIGAKLVRIHASNQGCGDELDADLVIKDGKVIDIKWTGTGCAISQASMSILSQWFKGKTVAEIQNLELSQLLELLGLSVIAEAREKCLTLPQQLFVGQL